MRPDHRSPRPERRFAAIAVVLLVPLAGCEAEVRRDRSEGSGRTPDEPGDDDAGASGGGAPTTSTGATGATGDGTCTDDGASLCFMARNQSSPWGIATDGDDVFWAASTVIDGRQVPDGTVRRCRAVGCGDAPDAIAENLADPVYVAVDATDVCWTTSGIEGYGEGGVHRCAKSGCADGDVVVAELVSPFGGLAIDATRVYWGNARSDGPVDLLAAPRDGGAPDVIGEGSGSPARIARDASALVWTTWDPLVGYGLWACDPSQCQPWSIRAIEADTPFAMRGDDVYFVEGAHVVKCPLEGCVNEPDIVATIDVDGAAAMVVDGADLYFTAVPLDVTRSGVFRCSADGTGEPAEILATGPDVVTPYFMAVGERHVFWTDATTGAVMRIGR